MASVRRHKIQPSVVWEDKNSCDTADHEISTNSSSYDSSEGHSNGDQINTLFALHDELETITAELDSSSVHPGLHEALLSEGVLRKRCHWFDNTPDAANADIASSSQDKRSAAVSPKQICSRLGWQRHKSSSFVHSLRDEEEPESDCSNRYSPTAPRKARPTQVPICLPPGCIPTEVIVQVPGKTSQSKQEATAIVMMDSQLEVDPWIIDICDQALTQENPAQPGLISASLPALTVVHDLEEDISPENNLRANTVLNKFLQNQRVVYRRNAICEELEMNTGFVKINGVKFSLWHLRAELLNTFKYL